MIHPSQPTGACARHTLTTEGGNCQLAWHDITAARCYRKALSGLPKRYTLQRDFSVQLCFSCLYLFIHYYYSHLLTYSSFEFISRYFLPALDCMQVISRYHFVWWKVCRVIVPFHFKNALLLRWTALVSPMWFPPVSWSVVVCTRGRSRTPPTGTAMAPHRLATRRARDWTNGRTKSRLVKAKAAQNQLWSTL
jgi:hypothetical protein